jgi:hypothetical protein
MCSLSSFRYVQLMSACVIPQYWLAAMVVWMVLFKNVVGTIV